MWIYQLSELENLPKMQYTQERQAIVNLPAHPTLLPCPFCGTIPAGFDEEWNTPPYWILCQGRNCIINAVKTFNTKEEAINAWNTRTTPAQKGKQS
jgi:hypothetical protein